MKTKRFLSLMLTLCMLVTMLPGLGGIAHAAGNGKAIQLVTGGAAANITGAQASSVNFGMYPQSSDGSGGYNDDPIKWRVLQNAVGHLLLLSDQNLDACPYHKDNESVTWERSTVRSWLNGYAATENDGADGANAGTDYTGIGFIDRAFSPGEYAALAETTLNNDNNPEYGTVGGNVTFDKVFLLSIVETKNTTYGFTDNYSPTDTRVSTNTAYTADGGTYGSSMNSVGEADYWWLRSPGYYVFNAAYVEGNGHVYYNGIDVSLDYGVRPAFNLNLNSVLFTSAAAGGKSSGAVGQSALTAVPTTDTTEWKLTLLDAYRIFGVTETAAEGKPGDTVELNYTGATTGTNEYVSAILCNNTGEALYYGRLVQPSAANGKVSVTIPDLEDGTYTLKVFSEQYNGDRLTDYSSAFDDVTLTVKTAPTTYDVTVTPGANMTKTTDSGGASQTVTAGVAMTDVIYTAAKDYYFPTDYTVSAANGISVSRDSFTQITVSGTPTADTNIVLTDPTPKAKEAAPTAAFTATGPDTGTLSNVTAGMTYSVDGGAAAAITGTSADLTGLAPCTITVIQPGNGTTTIDSDPQTITVTKAATPGAVTAEGCTDENNNDGKLVGVTADMEYKSSDADTWTNGTGSDVTGLVPGNYLVRVKAEGLVLASEAATLTVAAYTPPEQVKAPVLSPAAGSYVGPQSVTITCETEGADVYVIVGGTVPALYSGPLTITETTTLKAYATKAGMTDSAVAEATYTILPQTWTVTVNNGTGGGSYAKGETVTITANTAPSGKVFDRWVSADGVTFANPAAKTATFAMPDKDVTVTATYKNEPSPYIPYIPTYYKVTIANTEHGTVSATPTTATRGSRIVITADPDAGCEVDTVIVTAGGGRTIPATKNENGTYTFKLPDDDVTVKVTFRAVAKPFVNPFIDVPEGSYYYDAVMWAVQNGITSGTGENTFSPEIPCTRAQMVTFLWRTAGNPEPTLKDNPFSDLDVNAYYYKAVLWANENGITYGVGGGKFAPDSTVTRGQMVTFLFRALGGTAPVGVSNPFSDVKPGTYYDDAVLWAYHNGITMGTSATTFNPEDDCLRAQIVTFLYRAYGEN